MGRRLAAGTFWSLLGALISRGMTLAAFVFVANHLGSRGFGELGAIQSTTAVFSVFAGFGLGLTSNRYVASLRSSDPAKAGRVIALASLSSILFALVSAGVLFLIAPLLAAKAMAAPHLVTELRIASLIMVFTAINGAQLGALAGFEAFARMARANFWSGLLSFPLLLGGAHLGGVRGAIIGLVITHAVNCLIYRSVIVKVARQANVPISYRDCLKERNLLWRFSLPAILTDMLMAPMLWICTAILVRQPGGYSQMGIFNAASQWRAIILFLPSNMIRSSMPVLFNLLGRGEVAQFRKVFRYTAVMSFAVSTTAVVLVSLVAPWIMRAYGSEFRQGSLILIVMAVSAIPNALSKISDQVMASAGRMWQCMGLSALLACLNVGFALVLVPRWGALGLAVAVLGAYTVYSVAECVYANMLAIKASVPNREPGAA